MSRGVGRRQGLDLVLLWLWPAAVAPIRLLVWEPPHPMGAALKSLPPQKKCHLPSGSTRIKSLATAMADLSELTLKGVQNGD